MISTSDTDLNRKIGFFFRLSQRITQQTKWIYKRFVTSFHRNGMQSLSHGICYDIIIKLWVRNDEHLLPQAIALNARQDVRFGL
jgi:hypothetical protein